MNVMKLIPTIARYLLGLIFVVFGLNFWLQFLTVPSPPEGSLAAGFIGAIYLSGFLAVVKVFEVVGGILLLAGRYVNLALAVVGPLPWSLSCITSSSLKQDTAWLP